MRRCLRLLFPVALVLLASLSACQPETPRRPLPRAVVSVAGHPIQVEVADSPAARERGLSGRPALATGHGMLFPYAPAERVGFWMKGMRFDLDLVWIRDGRVAALTLRAPHQGGDPPAVYRSAGPVDAVLEVPAGTAERLGWRRGDPVVVDPQRPPVSGGGR